MVSKPRILKSKFGNVSMINNKETGGMATDFDRDVSYLKNYVVWYCPGISRHNF